jgi:hypothetical protein
MGLDMYLEYKTMIGTGWTVDIDIKPTPGAHQWPEDPSMMALFPDAKISYITQEVAYWRKANQIHGWFVRNVQNGVDDCAEYYVPVKKLVELHDICLSLLKRQNSNKARILLPPQPGFFFGSYKLDEDYWKDLGQTVDMLGPLLNSSASEMGSFIYSSSW